MLQSVEGIVTRTVKYGESSLIFDLLTSDEGIKSFIVGGVRRKGKQNRAALIRVLNIVSLQAYSKDPDKLSRVKEISYSYIYESLPFDVVKASIATFIIEICRKAAKVSDDYPRLYHFIVKGLIHLDKTTEGLPHFHVLFLLNLSRLLGFEITNNYREEQPFFDLREGSFTHKRSDHRHYLDAGTSQALHQYLAGENYTAISRQFRLSVLLGIVDFYTYHIEEFGTLKSLDVLRALYD